MTAERVHHEVIIAGFGGQGVVLAGRLLAAAALAEGREVVWAPSYGPEMRGGPVHCTVIVSSQRIGSPEVSLADSLILMDRSSVGRFADRTKPGGLLVLNSSLIPDPPSLNECHLLQIPANQEAEGLGDPRVANVILLGGFLESRPVVSAATLEDVIRRTGADMVSDPARREALIAVNLKALARGAALARRTNP